MMARTGDSHGDIQLRSHGFAGLTHLARILKPAEIDCDPARSDGSVECVSQLTNDCEAFRSAYAAASGDDAFCFPYVLRFGIGWYRFDGSNSILPNVHGVPLNVQFPWGWVSSNRVCHSRFHGDDERRFHRPS